MLRPRPIPAMLRRNNSTMDNRNFPVHLDSGEAVLVRPIGRHDADRMRAGIAALSDHSRYLRFFNGGQTIPDHVVEKLCDADGVDPDKFCGIACYGQQGGVLLRGYHKYANQAARILADENRLTSPPE